jgi:hypothetical protein
VKSSSAPACECAARTEELGSAPGPKVRSAHSAWRQSPGQQSPAMPSTAAAPEGAPMPETDYILAVLAITFSITFALRAAPFAVLGRLKESTLIEELSRWIPSEFWASWQLPPSVRCRRLFGDDHLRRCRSRRDNRHPPARRPAHAAQRDTRNSRVRQPGQPSLSPGIWVLSLR